MQYNFNLEHPLFFTKNEDTIDSSPRYSVLLPYDWHEVSGDYEWVNQYPMDKYMERQGWKVHISAIFKQSHEVLEIVAEVCHNLEIPFKYLKTEKRFILRNNKLVDRGFSGKFITCYPNHDKLEVFLNILEKRLNGYSGPYILSDKRWKRGPIYLRYGVFRSANSEEPNLKIDELDVSGKITKDLREPRFIVPEGIEVPQFLKNWLNDSSEALEEFPFNIESAIRFSNCGGIYNAELRETGNKMILRESRPYTGLDFSGEYSDERLKSEEEALTRLSDVIGVPKVLWSGRIWEHLFLGVEKMEGVSLNTWTTSSFPLYKNIDKDKVYLRRATSIIEQIIDIIECAHLKQVYHQDIHLGNILVDSNDVVSLIDWEQAVFTNDKKREQKMAAPGFGTWIDDYPSQIDWNGVRQIAYFLYYPLIEQSSLVLGYTHQVSRVAYKLFVEESYDLKDIEKFESILKTLDKKCSEVIDLSNNKILKPLKRDIQISSEKDVEEVASRLARGLTLVRDEWKKLPHVDREFPVHYYGIDINQGVAFSDLAILWSYEKLLAISKEVPLEDYLEVKKQVISKTVDSLVNDSLPLGLFDGVAGSIWLIFELGNRELALELFIKYYPNIIKDCTTNNLYSGKAGVLLVALYIISKGFDVSSIKDSVLDDLSKLANQYKHSPNNFFEIDESYIEKQSNDPYENYSGLLYGHLGLAWMFGEAYRLTNIEIYKDCLNLAVEMELNLYSFDKAKTLQYRQGKRLLPYLATGSAGLLILIARDGHLLSKNNLKYQNSVERAVDANFCVFPGLFNGFTGLRLYKSLYIKKEYKTLGEQKELLEGLTAYISVLEKGYVLAGDSGLKLTTDVATGFGGIALAMASIRNKRFELLPNL